MKLFVLIMLVSFKIISAQNRINFVIKDHDSEEPLIGVNVLVEGTTIGTATDQNGNAQLKGLPDGELNIVISSIGYEEISLQIIFPADNGKVFELEMESEAEEIEEISVTSTRYSRLIENSPTRVEVIAGEEIDEKISMDPSNISMLLNESTGIQVQQTSASSINNSFRIQGLEGRYTQLLQDGFPLYSGYAGSLSIMQIPPLNLRQVEIIKGSSSTLYGGGAIAGLIDLVTKEPAETPELSFLLNGTSALGLDLSGYYSAKSEKTGITLLATGNTQQIYDNNDDSFSDLPKTERYSFSPRLYNYINPNNTLIIGATLIHENRVGGYVPVIKGDSAAGYREENLSSRFFTQIDYTLKLNPRNTFNAKNSIGYFEREINPSNFSGKQLSTFTELSFHQNNESFDWIAGLNLVTDDFDNLKNQPFSIYYQPTTSNLDYSDIVYGSFLQGVIPFSEQLSLEAGIRADYTKDYDIFILPRISMLFKLNSNLVTRLGAGLGYKLPGLFTEDAEEILYQNIYPLDKEVLEAEKSYGLNFDINYNTILFHEITFSVNNLFFYTRINKPLLLESIPFVTGTSYQYVNSTGHLDTRGTEINLRITYHHLKFFAGYSYTDALYNINGAETKLPLTAPHRLGLVLIYEEHHNYRIGLEAYYTSEQQLSNGSSGRSYWVNGLMAEKRFGNISLFLNFENFLDTKQSRFAPMYTGTIYDPDFAEIYAPTDGRIINGGIKITL